MSVPRKTTIAMKPSVSPTPCWNARGISARGILAATPTKNEPRASAMNAGILTHVIRMTTRATPRNATRSNGPASTGGKVCRAYNVLVGLTRRSVSILGACVVLAGAVTTSAGREPQNGRAWPPPVHRAPTSSPVLSPEDEMKTFFLPRGYRVELVASEPMIEEPVLVDFDLAGRLWVVEMPAYMRDSEGEIAFASHEARKGGLPPCPPFSAGSLTEEACIARLRVRRTVACHRGSCILHRGGRGDTHPSGVDLSPVRG